MRKHLALLLALLALCALAGCGSQPEEQPVQVGLVAGPANPAEDELCQPAWERLEAIGEVEAWLTAERRDAGTYEDCRLCLRAFAQEGKDLVVCFGVPGGMVTEAAEAYPQTRFALLSETDWELPNVVSVAFARNEEGYLAGLAAGLTTDSGTVGYVQAGRQSRQAEYAVGYLAGVRRVNAKARVIQTRVRSTNDLSAGQSAGVDLVSNGADVIYYAAERAGEGVIAACQIHGVWAIGANGDQSALAPKRVLTSTLRRADTAVEIVVRELAKGRFQPGLRRFGLAEGGVSLTPGLMSEEVASGVETAVKRVQNGTVSVPATVEELEALYPGLYTLGN